MMRQLGRALWGASIVLVCISRATSADAPPRSHLATGTKVWLSAANAACADSRQPDASSALIFVWSGQCQNNLLEGPGTLTVFSHGPLAVTLKGTFTHGVAEGQEVLVYAAGLKFAGEFHGNEPNGHGVATSARGDVTQGDFKNDVLEGPAVLLRPDGSKYSVTYNSGVLDGHFTFEKPNIYREEGTFRSGKIDGSRVTIFADGGRLEEEFANGVLGPAGAYVDPRGNRIAGNLVIAKADPSKPHSVDYPKESRRNNEQGTVEVQVTVLADGHVADARVEQSSGVAGLDDAAREAVRTWTYLPATVDGHPVPSVRNITIPFVLHDPVEPKGD